MVYSALARLAGLWPSTTYLQQSLSRFEQSAVGNRRIGALFGLCAAVVLAGATLCVPSCRARAALYMPKSVLTTSAKIRTLVHRLFQRENPSQGENHVKAFFDPNVHLVDASIPYAVYPVHETLEPADIPKSSLPHPTPEPVSLKVIAPKIVEPMARTVKALDEFALHEELFTTTLKHVHSRDPKSILKDYADFPQLRAWIQTQQNLTPTNTDTLEDFQRFATQARLVYTAIDLLVKHAQPEPDSAKPSPGGQAAAWTELGNSLLAFQADLEEAST